MLIIILLTIISVMTNKKFVQGTLEGKKALLEGLL